MLKKMMALCAAAVCVITAGSLPAQAAEAKTGVGLSNHVMKAYTENWKYSYGSYGQLRNGARYTDCSGLIKSYLWWTGDTTNPNPSLLSVSGTGSGMMKQAKVKGTINYKDWSSLPRVHGLILHQPGHVGVYVGNNMAIDNRTTGEDMKYEKVFGRARNKWVSWFKLPQLSYPETGFATYNGQMYYYENGEYAIKTTRTVGDSIYTIDAAGVIISTEPTPAAAAAAAAALAPAAEAVQPVAETTEQTLPQESLLAATQP